MSDGMRLLQHQADQLSDIHRLAAGWKEGPGNTLRAVAHELEQILNRGLAD